jgi:hypothetical protein
VRENSASMVSGDVLTGVDTAFTQLLVAVTLVMNC